MKFYSIVIIAILLMATSSPMSFAAEKERSESVISVSLKSYDKTTPKDLKVEYQNMSGKEISERRGSLTFTDKAGKVLFTTGVTENGLKWLADTKSEEKPFMWFAVPPELIAALDKDTKSVTIRFKTSYLKFADGTEQKF